MATTSRLRWPVWVALTGGFVLMVALFAWLIVILTAWTPEPAPPPEPVSRPDIAALTAQCATAAGMTPGRPVDQPQMQAFTACMDRALGR